MSKHDARNDESHIDVSGDRVMAYVGPDAVNLFRAKTLYSSLRILSVGMLPTRGFTAKRAFAMVTEYTGKKYKRGEFDKARADLKVWIDNMLCAMPIKKEENNA